MGKKELSVNWGNHLANGTVFNPETVFGSDGQTADDDTNFLYCAPTALGSSVGTVRLLELYLS